MGSRKTHEGAEAVYEAAQRWVDCALRSDDSLFTPGTPIWTPEGLGELRTRFLNQPDKGEGSFYDKLSEQLADSPPEVYQLMGEVMYVHFLIVWHGAMKPATKAEQIAQVLQWSTAPVTIPGELDAGLKSGIAHPGTAFNTYRPYQVGCIIEFAERWKEEESSSRNDMLTDPWEFKNLVMDMRFRSLLLADHQDTPGIQRHALLHLVHPDAFEGTVTSEQKAQIAGAEAFAHFITEDTPDVDRKLAQIRRGLEAGLGRDFDFYDPNVSRWWDRSASDAWNAGISVGSEFLDSGNMWPWELKYKYDIAQKLAAGREAVLNDAEDWQTLVKRGITGIVVFMIAQSNFKRWIDDSPNEALEALKALWADDDSPVAERIRAFSGMYPRKVRDSATGGAGSRMNVISQLLMGLDVEKYPPFRVTAFDRAYRRTGYEEPPAGADEAALYEHALGFLDRFMEEARARGVPVRHRLDAQSLAWHIYVEERYGPDAGPAEQGEPDLDALAEALHLTDDFLEEIETLLLDKKQVIFQGPPGTGKTYVAQRLARHMAGSDERVTLVQLHPSYAYEDFVRGFRPTLNDAGQAGFELRDGPLLRAAERARSEPDAKHFLVIDEINRGAPAKVLGELYFLLEYRDEKVRLQYQGDEEEDFSLPPNLYFIGTMNTADRSIALVDLALRRRFYFVEFHPDDEPVKSVLRNWLEEKAPGMEWVADVVEEANVLLETDRHAAIGPSYFMKDGLDETAVRRIWKHSVLSYIEERLIGEDDARGRFALDALRGPEAATGGEEATAQNDDGEV